MRSMVLIFLPASDEIDMALDLAAQFPNFSGVMMDDFFRYDEASGRIAVHTAEP